MTNNPKGLESLIREMPKFGTACISKYCDARGMEIQNLRTVGRSKEAELRTEELLDEVLNVVKIRLNDPKYALIYTDICVKNFNKMERAKIFLEEIVNNPTINRSIDLTNLYYKLGYVYSKIYGFCELQLWAYHSGAEFKAPNNYTHPASLKEKAKCHNKAQSVAKVLADSAEGNLNKAEAAKFIQYFEYNFHKLRQIVPNVDWNNRDEVTRWLMSK